MKKISKKEALDRLARENLVMRSGKELQKIYSENFWALYNLTRKANSFELIYNDERLDEIPGIVNKNF